MVCTLIILFIIMLNVIIRLSSRTHSWQTRYMKRRIKLASRKQKATLRDNYRDMQFASDESTGGMRVRESTLPAFSLFSRALTRNGTDFKIEITRCINRGCSYLRLEK